MALTARVTNMNGQVVAEKRSGQHRVVTADPLGSVIDVRDTSATQLASYNYWPYGEIRTSTGSITNPWRFCGTWGYYFDGRDYYVRARLYQPLLTKWLTLDKIWRYSAAAYSYAGSSPSRYADPSGLYHVSIQLMCGEPMYVVTIEASDALGVASGLPDKALHYSEACKYCRDVFPKHSGKILTITGSLWNFSYASAKPLAYLADCHGKSSTGVASGIESKCGAERVQFGKGVITPRPINIGEKCNLRTYKSPTFPHETTDCILSSGGTARVVLRTQNGTPTTVYVGFGLLSRSFLCHCFSDSLPFGGPYVRYWNLDGGGSTQIHEFDANCQRLGGKMNGTRDTLENWLWIRAKSYDPTPFPVDQDQ